MGHAVDGDLAHLVVVGVILVGIGVEVTVAQAKGELAPLVVDIHVNAIGLGVLDVLVLAGLDGVILDDVLVGRLIVGDGH